MIPERLLLYPPFADPTQPYISLPVLKGHLKSKGMDARIMDLNIQAARFLLAPENIKRLDSLLEKKFNALNNKSSLSLPQQWEYQEIVQSRQFLEPLMGMEKSLVEIFQNPDFFYNYSFYSWAREKVDGLFQALAAAHFPYQYHFNKAGHFLIPWSFEMLEEYCSQNKSPLHDFYTDSFQNQSSCVDFIGISLSFVSQIPESFYLCRLLRNWFPHAFLMIGGSCLHQILSMAEEKTWQQLFTYVDAACVGEGEETLFRLFGILPQWQKSQDARERFDLIQNIPNLAIQNPHTRQTYFSPSWIADLHDSAIPDFTDLSLDSYLAPERILLYAPTRGCYWNKCSFCDYGFSRLSSHQYREIPYQTAAKQLEALSLQYDVKNFYLSCDVLAPVYALKLAQEISQKGLSIHWNTDLRIEKYYTPERCETLYQSGLRAVAFGVESGSDRMLACMNKGIQTKLTEEINQNFHNAGIATAWMAFHYHPGETLPEARKTIDWIERQKEYVDLFIVGEFGLTSGSHIACHPSQYGLKNVYYLAGDEFKLYPAFEEKNPKASRNYAQTLDAELSQIARQYTLMHYPWAGAISTHHSFLYFLRFGQRAFAGMLKQHKPHSPFPTVKSQSPWKKLRYSLQEIASRKQSFLEHYCLFALAPDKSLICPLSISHLSQETSKEKPLESKSKK